MSDECNHELKAGEATYCNPVTSCAKCGATWGRWVLKEHGGLKSDFGDGPAVLAEPAKA